MTLEEVENITSVLKACSQLRQVKVAMQVYYSLEEHVIPKKIYEDIIRVCLDCDDLEQASLVMKQAETVVVVDTTVKDRYVTLFTALKANEVRSDMRPDVPEFLPKFHRETFNPHA